VLCLVAACLALAPATGLTASVADWRADIEEIVKDVRLVHPDAFTKTGRLTFLRQARALEAALPRLSEEQRMVAAMRLVASIGDGHTSLEPDNPAFGLWYPFRLYQFSDGYFITAAHRSQAEIAGAQVLEIGGRPADEVVGEARRLMGADNDVGAREMVFATSNAGLMKGLGYASADGSLSLKLKLRNGHTVERIAIPRLSDADGFAKGDSTFEWRFRPEFGGPPIGNPEDWISAYRDLSHLALRTADPKRPPHLILRRAFVGQALPDSDAYYIQANCICNGADETFLAFFARAMAEVDHRKPRRLIVDLRFNVGGDGSKVPGLIGEFVKRKDAPPWRELYVLTGRRTFSAGVMALDAFRINTDATFVGEPAGAGLNSYGDAGSFTFPHTGMHMDMSTLRHELTRSTDIDPYTPVDVPAAFTSADYAAGRDPAVDAILEGQEMRALPLIARSGGGAAARRAYEARKSRFGDVPWWTAASDDAMTTAGYALVDQGRADDALEVFRLDTEIHGDFWRTWHNLGEQQLKAGRKAEGLESYRRALEDDPGNPESAAERAALAEEGAR
jgi:hypothetical protein